MITSNVRIPEDIWREIKIIAEKEQRSVNSQIIYIFQKFLEEQKKDSKESKK